MEIKTQQCTEEEVTDIDIMFLSTTGELQFTLRGKDRAEMHDTEPNLFVIKRYSGNTPETVNINMRNVLYVRQRTRTIRTPIKGGIEEIAPSGGRDTSGVVT